MSVANYLTAPNYKKAWLLLLPFLIYFAVFGGYPIVFSLYLGFVDWVGLNTNPSFDGFGNFLKFFQDETYTNALWNTLWIGGLVMAVNVVIGLAGAYIINMGMRGSKGFRLLWYLPAIVPAIAVSQVFSLFLNPSGGVINNILGAIGIEPVAWSYSYGWMVFWIVMYSAWKGIGATMILWLAGLQSIDREIYEQAEIDGANKVTVFFRITLPLLSTIAVYVMITGFVAAVQIFEPVMFISKTAPFGQTHVLTTRVFQDFYGDLNFGMAGATALVMTLLVGIFTLFTLRWYRSQGGSHV